MNSIDLTAGTSTLGADASVETVRTTATRRVWDLPTRLFHWSLVLSFAGAYATNRAGVEYFTYHLWFGYAVVTLVTFRIVWGIVGTRHARFWNFVRGPLSTARYTLQTLRGQGEQQHHAGHNPLGALMVIALLSTLFVQAATGLFSNDEIMNVGPLAARISEDFSLELTSLHRQLFYWILAAVGAHVVAVAAHVILRKDNLVRAMITGRKPADKVAAHEEIRSSRLWLAGSIVIVLVGTLAWIVKTSVAA